MKKSDRNRKKKLNGALKNKNTVPKKRLSKEETNLAIEVIKAIEAADGTKPLDEVIAEVHKRYEFAVK